MTDRPILYSGAMVRAMLADAKTETRRALMGAEEIAKGPFTRVRQLVTGQWQVGLENFNMWQMVPVRHRIGDRLWVREAWRTTCNLDGIAPRNLDPRHLPKVTFEADPENRNPLWAFGRLRAGMHMPRWASRLTLIVTNVRVQRLQDISEEDARAEGVVPATKDDGGIIFPVPGSDDWANTAKGAYKKLWDSLNADRAGGAYAWAANPWVVATTYSVIHQNIDQVSA